MAKKNGKVTEPVAHEAVAEEERNSLYTAARRVLLATVGGWALAWDEIEDFVNRLVERGEIAEHDARKLLNEMAEKRKHDNLEARMEEVLNRMDVPSKSDIHALSAKIAALTQKVEELKKSKA
jgi:polyhydroxyalkanoate synthesis regulator phasin